MYDFMDFSFGDDEVGLSFIEAVSCLGCRLCTLSLSVSKMGDELDFL